MNRNDIRPAVIGIASGVATIAALVACLEYDPWNSVAGRLAHHNLTGAERAELARIDQAAAERARQAREVHKRTQARQAERDADDIAGFTPALLSTRNLVTAPAELTFAQLADEIAHTEHTLRHTLTSPNAAANHRRHKAALDCEWRHRDSFDARIARSRAEWLRHRIATEKVNAARTAPWPQLPTVAPYI
ncbi:hypothetical protein [Nocardia salmonicida]|uniref:hypothetical protein n=1 Tax=Nocardia salmonicida TaxID=53431 RepID=UPI002E2E2AE0|nr:hypothetical protein [Nocardia salmonicida]